MANTCVRLRRPDYTGGFFSKSDYTGTGVVDGVEAMGGTVSALKGVDGLGTGFWLGHEWFIFSPLVCHRTGRFSLRRDSFGHRNMGHGCCPYASWF